MTMTTSATPADTPAPTAAPSRAGFTPTDLGLVLMAVIWGANFSAVKVGARMFQPLAFNSTRIVLGTLAMFATAAAIGGRWPTRREGWALVGLGALGNGFYQICFVEAVSRTPVANVAIVLASTPVWLALIGQLRGTDRIPTRGWVGIAISVAGIAMVVFGDPASWRGQHSFTGDLLAIGCVACWVVYTISLRPLIHAAEPLHIHALTMLGGSVPISLVAIPQLRVTPWAEIPASGWAILFYGSFAAIGFAYVLWYRGLKVLGPTRTAMYANLQPVVALVVAVIVLREIPSALQVGGAACTVAGVALTRS